MCPGLLPIHHPLPAPSIVLCSPCHSACVRTRRCSPAVFPLPAPPQALPPHLHLPSLLPTHDRVSCALPQQHSPSYSKLCSPLGNGRAWTGPAAAAAAPAAAAVRLWYCRQLRSIQQHPRLQQQQYLHQQYQVRWLAPLALCDAQPQGAGDQMVSPVTMATVCKGTMPHIAVPVQPQCSSVDCALHSTQHTHRSVMVSLNARASRSPHQLLGIGPTPHKIHTYIHFHTPQQLMLCHFS